MTKAPLRLLLALALLVGACVAPAAEAPPGGDPALSAPFGSAAPAALATSAAVTAAAADMTAVLRAKSLPPADIFSITRRVRGRSGSPAAPFEPVRLTAPSESVGAAEQFFVYDFSAKRNDRVIATKRHRRDAELSSRAKPVDQRRTICFHSRYEADDYSSNEHDGEIAPLRRAEWANG